MDGAPTLQDVHYQMIFMNEVEPPLESRPRTIAEDPAEDWRSIDWLYAEKQVRRLQTKISKAVSTTP